MINTQKIEIPNTDNCAIVTSMSFMHSHTFDSSKMYVIDAERVDEIDAKIKEKLQEMSLKAVNTYNKRFERSVIANVLSQNSRFMLTHNVK